MSAVAEPIAYGTIDDGLARRNAMVLAVAQALAGGNNTVIVSTASIVGAVLAPDKGLATLPITAMVIGMWLGTLPVGALARRFGRRFALQIGSVFGVMSGLISYVGGAERPVLAVAGRHVLRRALCRRASILPLCRRRYRERGVPAQGGVLGAGRRRIRRGDRAAARHLHQGPAAAVYVRRQLSRTIRLRAARRGCADVREGAAAAGQTRRELRGRSPRSCARPASSSRSPAAWRAMR